MSVINQLYILIRPYRAQIIIATLLLLGHTAIDMVLPVIVQQVIDVGLLAGEQRFLIQSAIIIAGLGLVKMLLVYRWIYLTRWIAQKTAFDLRNRLYNHIQRLSFSYHDNVQSGQLISRCIEDVRSVQNFSGNGIMQLIRVVLLLTGIVIILFVQNARLATITLLPFVPLILLTTSFGRRVSNLFYSVDYALGVLSSRLQENVVGVQVVRAFARERFETRRFENANRTLFTEQIKTIMEFAMIMPTSHLIIAVGTILLLWFGGRMVMDGELSLGALVAFNSYLLILALPIRQLTWLVNQAGEAAAGLKRSFEVLSMDPEIQSPQKALVLPKLEGEIVFDKVDFGYSGERTCALHDINLVVEPNQVVALIGPTGSGKTSLVNLIPRFYDVSEGAIRVDGHDVRQVKLSSLRKQIGIVLQTSLLFSATIRENLAYGNPDLSLEEIISAAKVAQAHGFIMEMPEGYETMVGERGVTLSGGQRQRVAIARAILMDPRILILDDSTSSVDTQTEQLIQRSLYSLMEGRTTFVIAQRLTTVQRADMIVVLDEGRIVESGSHHELLELGGLYREIYELQLREQEVVADD
jgi:ATP-binding cassette subfamily B protein